MCAQRPTSSARGQTASPVHERFTAALASLVDTLKQDRSIVAAILCGSLSHDTVWAKSDIDLLLISADDRQADRRSITLDADGIHVHAQILPRLEFRRAVEGALHNSFMHSYVAKGQVLFTHDPTIGDLHARLRSIGDRDTQVQLLRAAVGALSSMDKARKWFVTRGDLDYTALWILYAATSIARIEIIGRKLVADREVIPQASALNPALFRVIYTDLLNARKTRVAVQRALETLEAYVRQRAPELFALVVGHLQEIGEARTCTDLDDHFTRHYDIAEVTSACEYLASEGLLGKASLPARLTKRSTIEIQELAFFALGTPGMDRHS